LLRWKSRLMKQMRLLIPWNKNNSGRMQPQM
jgi:hypothetical protein